jgi:hypothetical protein
MNSPARSVMGEVWIVRTKILPPAGRSTPQSSCTAREVSAI